jgi:uncharacterized Zn-binding protein involved in type VI secretion
VLSNGLAQARATDSCTCTAAPMNMIVTGAELVLVNGLPAARLTDKTMHQPAGTIVTGSPNVFIGGPTVGVTLGGGESAKKACAAVAATRHTPGSRQQSYGNCGLESWRSAINAERAKRGLPPLTEDQLLQRAHALNAAGNDPVNKPWAYGATSVDDRTKVLNDPNVGLPASRGPSDPEGIRQAVAEKRHVTASVHPTYWPGATEQNKSWNHEVAVTGIEYDAEGRPVAYIINDTALGKCGMRVPAATFEGALIPGAPTTVSDKPVY